MGRFLDVFTIGLCPQYRGRSICMCKDISVGDAGLG